MKFNGRSISFHTPDLVYVELLLPNGNRELYSMNLPAIGVHNIIIGTTYMEFFGKTKVSNHTTGDYSDLDFIKRGWSGKNVDQMTGFIKNKDGE